MILKTNIYKNLFFVVLFIICHTVTKAQYTSQEELKKAAEGFFAEQEYTKALPLYSQLLSNYPKDPDYNYKYGACYFFGNRDKEASLKYLTFAVSKPNVNPQAFYFLGLALQHEYQFAAAEANYTKFREKGQIKDIESFQVDRKIEMCRNGATLLKSMTDIGVLQKKEIKSTEFFRSYDLKGIGGKVVVKPDEFKTKYDIKRKESSVVHIGDSPKMVVFSSYGDDGKNGKDIFKVVKLPNGEWSKPSVFPDVNTKFDEDYPFLHPDGQTLYFSSKGYNSMGGYDIFKSTFDVSTGKWTLPENIDFPINTPDDDILFISDIDNELAYFASSRASKEGELTVYKVKVDRQPTENTVVKGIFIAEANPSMKSATISILDTEKDRKYGVFTTNNQSGEYVLVFPGNGGKFKVLVETTNTSPIHSAIIELPSLEGFRALKQELRLVGEGSSEKLVVKNLFDESDEFDFNDPLIVENLLKQKAKMDVNLSEDELNNSFNDTKSPAVVQLSNEELKDISQQTTKTITENAKLSKAQASTSYDLAMKNVESAKQLFVQSEQQKKIASESQNTDEKITAFAKSEQLKMDAAKLVNEAVAALNMAKSLDSEATERESDVKKVNELNQLISTQVGAGKRTDAETAFNELTEISNSTYHKESAIDKEKEVTDNKLTEKEAEYNKVRNDAIQLTNREIELNEQMNSLTSKLEKTSKKTEKQTLQSQIDALKIDIKDTKYDLGVANDQEQKLKVELSDIRNSSTTMTNVLSGIKGADKSIPARTIDKTVLNNEIAFFEKQGLVGLYPSETTTSSSNIPSSSFDLAKEKDNYSIISDEGKIIDYNTTYSSKLVDAQQISNPNEKAAEMAKINNQWISDINQEIEIRQKQLAVSDNLNDKTKFKSRIEVLNSLKTEKQKDADQHTMLANQSNSVNSNQTTNETITDNNGNIIDYSSNYEKELTQLESKGNSNDVIKDKIAVYEKWKNANEQEILLKKVELSQATDTEKPIIQNRIDEINDQIKNNEEYVILYKDKLAEQEMLTSQSPNNTKVQTNVESKSDVNINYSEEFNNQILAADKISDPISSSKEKEKITQKWIETVDQDIDNKNQKLSNASEADKADLTQKIAELKSEKQSLVEQLSEIQQIRTQQESIIAKNTASSTKENTSQTSITTSSANAIPEKGNENVYTSSNAKNEIAQLKTLQAERDNLNNQAEQKTSQAYSSTNESEKATLLTEANELKKQSEKKETEIAQTIEKANKAEFYNNQSELSKFKSVNNPSDNNLIIADMNQDESAIYFDKAQTEREKATNATSHSERQSATKKAEEMEKTAILKQQNALELYKSYSPEVVAENTQLQTNTTNIAANSNTSASSNQPNETNLKALNLENEALTEEDKAVISKLSPEQINTIKASPEYTEYVTAKTESRRLLKEAEVDYVQSNKFKEEANDQKILDGSLSKMADATTDEAAKTKLKGQLVKLANMIKENETKSQTYNDQALAKQTEAKSNDAKAESIIASNPNSKEIIAIEKAESANVDLTAMASTNSASSESNQTQTPINTSANKTSQTNKNTETIAENNTPIKQQEEIKTQINETVSKVNETTTSSNESSASNNVTSENNHEVINNEATNKSVETADNTINKVETINTVQSNEEPTSNNVSNTQINNNTAEANTQQNKTTDVKVENSTAVEKEPVVTNQQNQVANQPTDIKNIDKVPDVLTQSIFVLTPKNSAAYSENNKIPPTTKLPEGLVFKVQIGAFRNPIPQDHYRGFAPIMTEDAGNGITRYTAGLFNTFNMANEAKEAIRTIGYPDAFVVAFYNGKRININEARTMTGGSNPSPEAIASTTQNNTSSNQQNTSLTSTQSNINTTSSVPAARQNVEMVEDGISTDVNKIKGVFFTVQVGVYSKPITADQLNNVTPLNSEKTSNGLIRYTSGVYTTLPEANSARDRIKGMGISDAFVVAYANGNRVAVNDAVNFVVNGNQVAAPSNNTTNHTSSTTQSQATLNNQSQPNSSNNSQSAVTPQQTHHQTPSDNAPQAVKTNNSQPVTTQPKEPINQKEIGEKLNLVFSVILGEYTEEVPVDEAAIYLKIQNKGVKVVEEGTKTVYMIGAYPDYPSALDMQIEMKTEGVKKPKVAAYKNGTPIEVNEALELVKNNAK